MQVPLERQEAEFLTRWLYSELLPQESEGDGVVEFTHFANELRTPFKGTLRRMKLEGLRKGVPDYLVVVRKSGKLSLVFIELKRQKSGTKSPEQKRWIGLLASTDNVAAHFAHGAKEAIAIIESYFKRFL